MSKYGFDYFLQRTELISEMARSVSTFSGVSPALNNVYDKLMKYLAQKGVNQNGTRQLIACKWIISEINDATEQYTDEDGEPMDSSAIIRQLTGSGSPVAARDAAVKVASQNKELANDPKFTESLLDFGRFDTFQSYALAGNRRQGKENELQDVTGKGISDYEKSTSNVRDLVLTMNKLMGIRKRRKQEASGQEVVQTQSADYNPNIDFAHGILDAIETLQDTRNEYLKEIQSGEMYLDELPSKIQPLISSKASQADLDYLKSMYTKMISDKTGTTPDEFNAFIQKLQGMKGMTPERSAVFSLLQQEISELNSHELLDVPSSESGYDGYDPEVVNKVLDTPEKKEAFNDWYSTHTQWRKAKNQKLEELYTRKMIELSIQSNPKLAGTRDNKEIFINPVIQQLMGTLQQWERRLEGEQNETNRAGIEKKIQAIQKHIAQIRQGQPSDPQEEQEENVMSYMTEQILRDVRTNQKGAMVDRGFKKPINYDHWMEINKNK
jgi:hypothetical protein